MTRSAMCVFALAVLIAAACAGPMSGMTPAPPPFSVVETGIPDLQRAMTDGRVTSRQLVVLYLTRIALYEDQLRAIVAVNPKVLEEAEGLDRERAQGKVLGLLHGIPMALSYPRRPNLPLSGSL